MKILFISHCREQSGVGRAAREYLHSMLVAGLDVVSRPIKLGLVGSIEPELEVLEKKSAEGCTHCIQFLLPHHMRFDGTFEKCVALFDYECEHFQSSGWPYILDMFNDVWVPSTDAARQAIQSGIEGKKVRVVPHAVNPKRYEGQFKNILGGDDSFVFYFIGEANNRKGIGSLIKAFHSEFGVDEGVSLLLKINKFGIAPDKLKQEMSGYINQIKTALKIYPRVEGYKQETLICDYLSEENILNLHNSCHCLISPSHGEAFNYTVLDALGMGKPCIVSDCGGHQDLVSNFSDGEPNGYKVQGQFSPVEGMLETFNGLSTGLESWFDIDISNLKFDMRQMFIAWSAGNQYGEFYKNAKKVPERFSREVVGNKIKELLSASNR